MTTLNVSLNVVSAQRYHAMRGVDALPRTIALIKRLRAERPEVPVKLITVVTGENMADPDGVVGSAQTHRVPVYLSPMFRCLAAQSVSRDPVRTARSGHVTRVNGREPGPATGVDPPYLQLVRHPEHLRVAWAEVGQRPGCRRCAVYPYLGLATCYVCTRELLVQAVSSELGKIKALLDTGLPCREEVAEPTDDALRLLRRTVLFLSSPDLDAGNPPSRSVADPAEHFLRVVDAELAARPMLLAGFSSGGIVAVEIARRAVNRAGVRRVVLIDTLPPGDGFDDLDDDVMGFCLHTIVARAGGQPDPEAPLCLGENLTPAKAAEVTHHLHAHDSFIVAAGVPREFLERRRRVYRRMIATNTHTVAPCRVPLAYLHTREVRSVGTSWRHAMTTDDYETVDVDRTLSSPWDNGIATAALAHFLDPAPSPGVAVGLGGTA